MAKKVKVYQTTGQQTEVNEVDFEEALKMIAEAKAKGRFVLNKKRGELIEDLKPDVVELLVLELIEIVEGG